MISFAFFGSSRFSTIVLDELNEAGILPQLIVTAPDRPKGRGLRVSGTPVKEWAEAKHIPVLSPESIRDEACSAALSEKKWDIFVVASFGVILPKEILDIPEKGVINVHPSRLPKWRGPSPIQTSIMEDDKDTGVSIMLLDEKMDHGPIIANEQVPISDWPPRTEKLEETLAHHGGKLLAKIIPEWISSAITSRPQNDASATYSSTLKKEDGLISLTDDPYKNFLKIQALSGRPGVYFFTERNGRQIRVKVTDAIFENGAMILKKIIPEGKPEMSYDSFVNGAR